MFKWGLSLFKSMTHKSEASLLWIVSFCGWIPANVNLIVNIIDISFLFLSCTTLQFFKLHLSGAENYWLHSLFPSIYLGINGEGRHENNNSLSQLCTMSSPIPAEYKLTSPLNSQFPPLDLNIYTLFQTETRSVND